MLLVLAMIYWATTIYFRGSLPVLISWTVSSVSQWNDFRVSVLLFKSLLHLELLCPNWEMEVCFIHQHVDISVSEPYVRVSSYSGENIWTICQVLCRSSFRDLYLDLCSVPLMLLWLSWFWNITEIRYHNISNGIFIIILKDSLIVIQELYCFCMHVDCFSISIKISANFAEIESNLCVTFCETFIFTILFCTNHEHGKSFHPLCLMQFLFSVFQRFSLFMFTFYSLLEDFIHECCIKIISTSPSISLTSPCLPVFQIH